MEETAPRTVANVFGAATAQSNTQDSNELPTRSHHEPEWTEIGNTALPPGAEDVFAPFEYIVSLPSKGVRKSLLDALNVWIRAPVDILPAITCIVDDVHNISLMLDDVQDSSPLRRARPATHSVFGMPQTVNSATFQIVLIIERGAQLGSADIIMAEMKNMFVGQGLDLSWVHNVTTPSVSEYLQMVDGKTGALFRMMARLMLAHSPVDDQMSASMKRLALIFGRFFQIRDDYANLKLNQYQQSKGYCEDLDEGKMSYILIHALQHAQARDKSLLLSLLMGRRATGLAGLGHKELIMDILERTGSLVHTAEALGFLMKAILAEIGTIEEITGLPNPGLRAILDRLRV